LIHTTKGKFKGLFNPITPKSVVLIILLVILGLILSVAFFFLVIIPLLVWLVLNESVMEYYQFLEFILDILLGNVKHLP
jgi:hypothetical protein